MLYIRIRSAIRFLFLSFLTNYYYLWMDSVLFYRIKVGINDWEAKSDRQEFLTGRNPFTQL